MENRYYLEPFAFSKIIRFHQFGRLHTKCDRRLINVSHRKNFDYCVVLTKEQGTGLVWEHIFGNTDELFNLSCSKRDTLHLTCSDLGRHPWMYRAVVWILTGFIKYEGKAISCI